MRLVVQYPDDAGVQVDGELVGRTNSVLRLGPGTHRIRLADAGAAQPEEHQVTEDPSSPDAVCFVRFVPQNAVLDRFSPLYCCYNGFLLGQFLALSFAAYAREGYGIRRARMQEFLQEIGVAETLPEEPIPFGSDAYDTLVQRILTAVHGASEVLADYAFLGFEAIFYGHLAAVQDPTAEQMAAHMEELRTRRGLPPLDLATLVPQRHGDNDTLSIDDVLSPSLAWLAEVVQGMEPEPDTAFVIMPFAPPWAGYFATFYRPALEAAGCRAFRAWGGLSNEQYADLLLALIARSGLVWADISERNPNVLYEIGAAHAFGRMAVLLVHEDQAALVPANIGHDAVITYSPSAEDFPDGMVRLMGMLIGAMRLSAKHGEHFRVGRGDLETAIDAAGERLKQILVPPEAREALQHGQELLDSQQFEAAETAFTDAIELGLDDAEAYAWRGLARVGREEYAAAATDLTEAIERGYQKPPLFRMRGLARNQIDDNEGADADFTAYLEGAPDDAEVWYFRGAARQSLGRWAEADMDFSEALARGFDSAELQQCRTWVNIRLGHADAARHAWERAAAQAPDAAATVARQGDLLLADHEYGEAVAAYERALAAEPLAERQFELGVALLLDGRAGEAQPHYAQGLTTATPLEVRHALEELRFWAEQAPGADLLRQELEATAGAPVAE